VISPIELATIPQMIVNAALCCYRPVLFFTLFLALANVACSQTRSKDSPTSATIQLHRDRLSDANHDLAKVSDVKITLRGFAESGGLARGAVFGSPAGWPDEWTLHAYAKIAVPIEKNTATIDLPDTPYGAYAIIVYHDQNENGKLDTGFMGIPAEKFGFSNNPKIGIKTPSFDATSFKVSKEKQEIAIDLRGPAGL
jgi:uncharacterized protein (DUF2141 family)